jgi:hypothetical protein
MIAHIAPLEQLTLAEATQDTMPHEVTTHTGAGWTLYEGDAVDGLAHIPDNSVGLTVSSPPFLSLYQYSATERDIGNCTTQDEFFTHLRYISAELMRITMPGRHVAWHVSQVPAMLVRDGWIGMKDFRGELVRQMESWGWIYHGEVAITKSPQAQAIRIHAKGLAFNQLHKDASWMRPALRTISVSFASPATIQYPLSLILTTIPGSSGRMACGTGSMMTPRAAFGRPIR